jgi:hypothetical protein
MYGRVRAQLDETISAQLALARSCGSARRRCVSRVKLISFKTSPVWAGTVSRIPGLVAPAFNVFLFTQPFELHFPTG